MATSSLADAGVVPRHAHDRAGYTVAAVAQALSTVRPPLASDELPNAFDWFAGGWSASRQ